MSSVCIYHKPQTSPVCCRGEGYIVAQLLTIKHKNKTCQSTPHCPPALKMPLEATIDRNERNRSERASERREEVKQRVIGGKCE